MTSENVETVRRLFEAFNAGGDLVDIFWTDETEIWPAPGFPAGGPFKGRAEAHQFFDGLREGWKPGTQVVIRELEEAGNDVLASFEWWAVGDASGIETSSEWWATYTFLSGKIVRVRFFNDREAAISSLGGRG